MEKKLQRRLISLPMFKESKRVLVNAIDVSCKFKNSDIFVIMYDDVNAVFIYKYQQWSIVSKSKLDLSFSADIAFELQIILITEKYLNMAHLNLNIELLGGGEYKLP